MFLVKREESRGFDVFFCVWKRGKICRRHSGREQNPGRLLLFFVWRVTGAFYSPSMIFKAMALQGQLPSNSLWLGWSWHPWKDLDFLFLKRYGTWKSNGWIKSYGFRKLVVHRLVHYPNFRDISAVLTLILTHK